MRRPAYYDNFKCKAGACTDSCCKGWEIDIDDETAEYYANVPGAFGSRLRENLRPPVEYEDGYEPAHFELTERRRCPFLNDGGLCDIILELGEEAISEVCTNHPRYYDWMTGLTEAGVGLACEEAARLILTDEAPGELIGDDADAMDGEEESELEGMLLSLRSGLIERITGMSGQSDPGQVSDELYGAAVAAQDALDDFLYGEADDDGADEKEESGDDAWSGLFWNEDGTEAANLIDFYLGLDINTAEWRDGLLRLKTDLKEIIAARASFRKAYPEAEGQYRRLLIYFLYRYLMRARYDEYLLERALFALISVDVIEMMDILAWRREGSFTLWDQICVCKLYSQEIEYDSDNVDLVSMYLTERQE